MSDIDLPVPMLDLTGQFRQLQDEWLAAIRETGGTGAFVLGPNVAAFESEFSEFVGVANGTDALLLSLRALDIGPGDEVITTPFTFFATAEVISLVGATPVFVDIEEDGFNIDPDRIAAGVTDRTRAIIPVHLFGRPADMTKIEKVAREHSLEVIEDCAQAFGAEHGGARVGSLGAMGCFSFYPTKILGGYGDGGMITARSAELAERLRRLRNHGATAPFVHATVGYNSRLDEIQAALLRIKLRHIDRIIKGRQIIAGAYDRGLESMDMRTPSRPPNGRHVFNLYTIRTPHRDRLREGLGHHNIGSAVCYPQPLHLQEVYRGLGYRAGSLPVAEALSREVLSLPIFPEMTQAQVDRVCEVIRATLNA